MSLGFLWGYSWWCRRLNQLSFLTFIYTVCITLQLQKTYITKIKVPMKRNFFHIFLKYTVWNTWFQSFRCLGLKLTILQANEVVPFCPQKWYFELRGQNTTWQEPLTSFGCQKINSVWRKVRRPRDNEADIALLVLPASEVVKTDHSHRASACISSPKILLWEANGFNSSVDRDTSRDLRTRLSRPISKNRVVRKAWPYSVAWKPKVFKWIGSLKKDTVPTRDTIVPPAPEELSDHRKRQVRFPRVFSPVFMY